MEAVAHRATDRRLILSAHRIQFRKPSRLIAATVSRFASSARHGQVLSRRPFAVPALAIGAAVVAVISVGTALLWPAGAASGARAAVPRLQTITGAAGAVSTIDTGTDARRTRPAALVASDHAISVSFIKAERARQAAQRRAAAQQLAAERAQAAQAAQPAPSRSSGSGSSGTSPQPSGSPQQIASGMLGSFGWGQDQFGCLVSLWNAESGWNPSASNPSSGAYGIPQALPGSKMASAGPDWQANPATQIRWGLGYIQRLYGSPCAAWAQEQSSGYY